MSQAAKESQQDGIQKTNFEKKNSKKKSNCRGSRVWDAGTCRPGQKSVTNRQTNRQTNIVKPRAAFAAKNLSPNEKKI